MTLQSRLLGVFAQYPDPRVGFFTTEIVRGAAYGTQYLSSGVTTTNWGRTLPNSTGLARAAYHVASVKCTRALLADPTLEKQLADYMAALPAQLTYRHGDDQERKGRSPQLLHDHQMAEVAKFWQEEHIPNLPQQTKFDILVPWIARLVAADLRLVRKGKHGPHVVYAYARHYAAYLSEIADWAHATHPNIMSMTYSQAMRTTGEWHDELHRQEMIQLQQARQQPERRSYTPGEVVYTYPDGWTVQKLTAIDQLKYESYVMSHCVGNTPVYLEAIQRGEIEIYSIRDAQNKSVITVEVRVLPSHTARKEVYKIVAQAKLRFNARPNTQEVCDRLMYACWHLHWDIGGRGQIQDLLECFDKPLTHPLPWGT